MNHDNLSKALEANRRFYAMKFPHIYGKGYNPDEPRDWPGRWTTGGDSNGNVTPASATNTTFNTQGAVDHLNQAADTLKNNQIA